MSRFTICVEALRVIQPHHSPLRAFHLTVSLGERIWTASVWALYTRNLAISSRYTISLYRSYMLLSGPVSHSRIEPCTCPLLLIRRLPPIYWCRVAHTVSWEPTRLSLDPRRMHFHHINSLLKRPLPLLVYYLRSHLSNLLHITRQRSSRSPNQLRNAVCSSTSFLFISLLTLIQKIHNGRIISK